MLKTRVISAVVAILILAGFSIYFGIQGLLAVCCLVGIIGCWEYARLAFHKIDAPLHLRWTFVFLASVILLATVFAAPAFIVGALAVFSVFFLTMAVMTVRASEDLPMVLQTQSAGLLGFLYCGLSAGLGIRLLTLENGLVLIFGLMAIVFTGDTFAYLAGRTFGKRKLLEAVSPKKTIEGSIGGLFGSALAGGVLGFFFLKEAPLFPLIASALITGAFAQVGDLFESLLKRVADVKDSGRIMPGHGGILDRIDGFIFGAPIFYVLVRFLLGS